MISGNAELQCTYWTSLKKFIGFKINLAFNPKQGQNIMRKIIMWSNQQYKK